MEVGEWLATRGVGGWDELPLAWGVGRTCGCEAGGSQQAMCPQRVWTVDKLCCKMVFSGVRALGHL
jgi:hypothetical protein